MIIRNQLGRTCANLCKDQIITKVIPRRRQLFCTPILFSFCTLAVFQGCNMLLSGILPKYLTTTIITINIMHNITLKIGQFLGCIKSKQYCNIQVITISRYVGLQGPMMQPMHVRQVFVCAFTTLATIHCKSANAYLSDVKEVVQSRYCNCVIFYLNKKHDAIVIIIA